MMTAGRLSLGSVLLLTTSLACGGCEQTEPLRQGVVRSSYKQELRQLAEETNRKELAKRQEETEETGSEEVSPAADAVAWANHWQAPPLLNAIHLQAPQPLDAGLPGPPPNAP
jgi:hypothetical protein